MMLKMGSDGLNLRHISYHAPQKGPEGAHWSRPEGRHRRFSAAQRPDQRRLSALLAHHALLEHLMR